jgi:hypothetical protein
VIEHPGFFLRQHHNSSGPVGEPLEHLVAPHRAVGEALVSGPVLPHGSPHAG